MAAIEELGLRERTLIIFSGDNGTSRIPNPPNETSSINGRQVSGRKGEMLEGGSLVPLIASWKGTMPAGRVIDDLVDFSDFLPTFAELADAKLPSEFKFDGHSFAPQLRGEKGNPRPWVFVQLGNNWYARNHGWKLNQAGELFSMRDAPFAEPLISAGVETDDDKAARGQLQAALDELNPAAGKVLSKEDKAKQKAKKPKKPKKSAKSPNAQA